MGEIKTVKSLYKDATNYEEIMGKSNHSPPVDGPYCIIDPRFIGYDYLSYMFIETGEGFSKAAKAETDTFDEHRQDQALMWSLCLGDYDVIHRRAEPQQFRHVQFTVEAKDQNELDFFKSIETYPIFSVGRWHGQDIKADKTLENGPNNISPLEVEILSQKIKQPNASPKTIRTSILEDAYDDDCRTEISAEEIETKSINEINDLITDLETDVILGTSITFNVPASNIGYHVLVGLTAEERQESNEGQLPNEEIMDDLMTEYDGWQMPYIVSGVGQNWADIIVEMRIDEMQAMNDVAEEIRSIDGIKSTKTYMITQDNFDEPLLIDDPNRIPAYNRGG